MGGNPRPFGIRDPNGRGIAIRAAAHDIFRGESSFNGRGIAIRAAARNAFGGFTLVEMLVVLAVVAILISILVPVLSWAQARARMTATAGDMRTIALALDAYHADFGMYPNSGLASSGTMYNGAIPQYAAYDYLAEALLGYLPASNGSGTTYDGAGTSSAPGTNTLEEDKGFKMLPYNRVYGPYVDIGASFVTRDQYGYSPPYPGNYYFADAFPPRDGAGINFGNPAQLLPNPILYFSANPTPSGTAIFNTTAGSGIFDLSDDSPPWLAATVTAINGTSTPLTSASPYYGFFALIGNTEQDNTIHAGENIIGQHSYLLISAGPDGNYFTGDDVVYGGH